MSASKQIVTQQMIDEIEAYPEWIQSVRHIEGFQKKFLEYQGDYRTYKQAYEATERFHIRYFGDRKYSSYNSFRKCMKDYLKKKANDNE